jgi:hypothetical protein
MIVTSQESECKGRPPLASIAWTMLKNNEPFDVKGIMALQHGGNDLE